jgi:hypothetical protein
LPAGSTLYKVEVTDGRRQTRRAVVTVYVAAAGREPEPPKPAGPVITRKPTPLPDQIAAQGPLVEALRELWEKARKARLARIRTIIVKLYDGLAIFKVHGAMAILTDAAVTCALEAELGFEGVEEFTVVYRGRVDKANAVKTFLDPQVRAADEARCTATYTIQFTDGLPLAGEAPEKLASALTRFGGGEAYVEAHAEPPESAKEAAGAH